MLWSKVIIGTTKLEAISGSALMNKFAPAFRAAGMPQDAKVYLINSTSDHIFYFNPAASVIAKEILIDFNATTCEDPNLDDLKPLKI